MGIGFFVKLLVNAVYLVVCLALLGLIMAQQGKSQGLGALTGQTTETYWSKIKGRSKEGVMIKATVILSIAFFVLSLLLSIGKLG